MNFASSLYFIKQLHCNCLLSAAFIQDRIPEELLSEEVFLGHRRDRRHFLLLGNVVDIPSVVSQGETF